MAEALFVSDPTVRSGLERLYTKIGVSSRGSAVLFAMQRGLLE